MEQKQKVIAVKRFMELFGLEHDTEFPVQIPIEQSWLPIIESAALGLADKIELEENERCQVVLARVFDDLGEQGMTLDQLQRAVTIAQLPDVMNMRCPSSPLCSHNTNGRDLDKPCSIASDA